MQENFHIRQALCFFLQHLVGFQFVHKFQNRHFRTNVCQIYSRFDTRISTADNRYVLTFIERTVAVRAKSDTFSDIVRFARNIQLAPACTCRHDKGRSRKTFTGRSGQKFCRSIQFDFIHTAMLQYIDRIVVDMCQKVVRQLLSGSLRNGNQVLDTDRFFDLSSDTFGYHCDIQAFTCRVDGRSCTGRSTPHY